MHVSTLLLPLTSLMNMMQVPQQGLGTAYAPLLPVSPRFTGQEKYLGRIRNYFASRGNSDVEQRRLLLHGVGGVGKTQLALKYAEENSDRFWRTFWIDASSTETMETSLKAISGDPEAAPAGVEATPDSVLRWLSAVEHDWLLIYDDAYGDPKQIDRYIPSNGRGNILLTSRNPDMRGLIPSPDANVEVDGMEEADAASLLLKWVIPKTSAKPDVELERLAKSIVKELCYLPLAVDQAGAVIQGGLCDIGGFLPMYTNHRKELMSYPSFEGASTYGRPVYVTWDLSLTIISTARTTSPDMMASKVAESALFLLDIFSVFHHKKIPEELFRRAAEAPVENSDGSTVAHSLRDLVPPGLVQLDLSGKWDPQFFRSGIQALTSFSLIRCEESGDMYSLHPLVHSWSQDRMSDEQRMAACRSASALLAQSITFKFSTADYIFRRELVPHIQSCQSLSAEEGTHVEDEYVKFGLVYQENGYLKDAEELNIRVLESRQKVLGEEHPDTMTSAANLAVTYQTQGRWREAEELGVRVSELDAKVLGAEHPATLTAVANLASMYSQQGRWKEAEELEVRVLESIKKVFGEDHPRTLTAMANLASTYSNQGRWEEAEDLEVRVLESSKKVLGEEHPNTLTSMANVASTYLHQGRWKEAEDLEVRVLESSKKVLGEEHPNTLTSMANLASTYLHQEHWKEAEDLNLRVLDSQKLVLGEEHPETLTSMANLVAGYRKQGRWKEAEKLAVQVLESNKKMLGEEHPYTLTSMVNLAGTWKALGRDRQAVELLQKVVGLGTKVLGPHHPEIVSWTSTLNDWTSERTEM